MPPALFTVAVLAVCLTFPLHAQQAPDKPEADSTDVLIVDHDFSAPGEYVRVFLQSGQVYRAELGSPDVVLQFRGVREGVVRPTQLPRVYRFLSYETPAGASFFDIYPDVDAEYEIRAVLLGGSTFASRFRLYRDLRTSARRQRVRNRQGWDIGIEMAGGWHSGYVQSSAPPPSGSDPADGTDIESCFSARAPGNSRLGLCAVGLSYQSQEGARNILWIYTEPRLRLAGARSGWDLGVSFRFGVGMISAVSVTPVTFAPGAYIARHLGRSANGKGWNIQASYARHFYQGFSRPIGVAGTANPTSNRFTLGVGWYQ
jgi:hypothetical protein